MHKEACDFKNIEEMAVQLRGIAQDAVVEYFYLNFMSYQWLMSTVAFVCFHHALGGQSRSSAWRSSFGDAWGSGQGYTVILVSHFGGPFPVQNKDVKIYKII